MLRIVVPPQFPDIAQRSKQVVWNQLLTAQDRCSGRTALVLRAGLDRIPHHRAATTSPSFYDAREAFSAPRFKALYRGWKQDGEPVLASSGSRAISDAVNAGAGCVETLELGHRYGHLSPLVAVA
jgi:hypothetical protein